MIGELIKTERELRGLTIAELARAAGISYQNLWNYEKGNAKPPQVKLSSIAVALTLELLSSLGIKATRRATLTETYIII